MEIKEIIDSSRNAEEVIADLKKKSIRVKPWSVLEKEYDVTKHPVMDNILYPDKPIKNGKQEKVTRITRGWQKLAVKRMSGLIFGIPVQRVYKPKNDVEAKVAKLMESIYQKNRIDSVNRKRAKYLYAACEFVTIWYTQLADTMYDDTKSKLKIRCKTFSPMDGSSLYPLFDEYDDLIALSVEYSRTENDVTTTYFETYTADEHIRWIRTGNAITEQEELREKIAMGKITGIYAHREEPIWEQESGNVYEAEWALSRNGNYLRKNARPNWVVYSDTQIKKGAGINKDDDGVAFLQYPSNAKAGYETWQQATESLKYHVDSIKQNFFMQLQLPDLSYENMKSQAMSGESRKMMFIDAQQKCLDESGIWLEAFDREVNVVRSIMKYMFPSLPVLAIDSLEVENVITPFQINDEAEQITNLSNATGGKAIMSQRTAVQRLGYVDDVDNELELIAEESMGDAMQQPMM